MNIERTRQYYANFDNNKLCNFNHCVNYRKKVGKNYPNVRMFLDDIGIDIEKYFEIIPIDTDDEKVIAYMAQYIVFGINNFEEVIIDNVVIEVAQTYLETGIDEENFVIEVGPLYLSYGGDK